MRDIRIAAICMTSEIGDPEGNLKKTEEWVARAKAMGAEIICFPECSITGYTLSEPERVYRVMSQGEVLEGIIRMARDHGVLILAGLVECVDAGAPYVAQAVAGPEGFIGMYRKTHLSPKEKGVYQQGDQLGVFRAGDLTFGVQLCYEAHFPEITIAMALQGAELVFIPHASPRGNAQEKTQSWTRHLPGRAFDNSVFIVACNQVGPTRDYPAFPGVALVYNPSGNLIAQYSGDEEHILIADLKKEELEETRSHQMKYFLPNRRPELYSDIVSRTKD